MDKSDKENKSLGIDDESKEEENYLAIGMCIGMCLGLTIGARIKKKK